MKYLSIILGVVLVIGGAYCLFTPVATYASLAWVIGLAMIVEGVGQIATWNTRRKLGFSDGWTLVGAIASVLLGIILISSTALQYTVDFFIAYLIASWLIIGGLVRIVTAVRLHSFFRAHAMGSIGSNWMLLLVLGVLVTIMGVLCAINPLVIMVGVGVIIGIAIIISGASLVATGLAR